MMFLEGGLGFARVVVANLVKYTKYMYLLYKLNLRSCHV